MSRGNSEWLLVTPASFSVHSWSWQTAKKMEPHSLSLSLIEVFTAVFYTFLYIWVQKSDRRWDGWMFCSAVVLVLSRYRSSLGAAATCSPQWCRSSGRGSLANERHLAWTDELRCCCWAWLHGKTQHMQSISIIPVQHHGVRWNKNKKKKVLYPLDWVSGFDICCKSDSATPTLTAKSNVSRCVTGRREVLF